MITNRHGYSVSLEFLRHLIDGGRLLYFSAAHAAGTAPIIYRIKTGAKKVNLAITLGAGAAAPYSFLENPTITADGTLKDLRNYNRNFSDNSLLTKVYLGPTVTGGTGTNFRESQVGFGDNPAQAATGGNSGELGYILKPNSEYVFTHTPQTSVVTTILFDMFETDK